MDAPVTVSVTDAPVHTLLGPVTESTGSANTVRVHTAVLVAAHPATLVPVIEYEVLVAGFTTLLPPEYVYVAAPAGTMVKLLPEQVVPLLTESVGEISTVTAETAATAEIQPKALVPVME